MNITKTKVDTRPIIDKITIFLSTDNLPSSTPMHKDDPNRCWSTCLNQISM